MGNKKLLSVRRLRAEDARSYRGALIEALVVHSDCFLQDYNAELSRPLTEIEEGLEQSGTFGALYGALLVGIASEVPCTESKRRHCGSVRNLYVREEYRGRGIGGRLLREILLYAADDLQQLEVQIPLRCESGVRLFEKFGFRMVGLLPNALKVDKEAIDVWTMSLQLV
jgi:GNAT superfamily N-acetyltransferase